MQEIRHRLRIGPAIVGFERQVAPGRTAWSADGYGWHGKPVAHVERDRWTGLYDRNRTRIFENDVVCWQGPGGAEAQGLVIPSGEGFAVAVPGQPPQPLPVEGAGFRDDLVVAGYGFLEDPEAGGPEPD